MKSLILTGLALCWMHIGYTSEPGRLNISQVQLDLTDLYYEMDDQLLFDHEIHQETFKNSLPLLQQIIVSRDDINSYSLKEFQKFETKSESVKTMRVSELMDYLALCSKYVLDLGKSR